jgi:hypothetical protein
MSLNIWAFFRRELSNSGATVWMSHPDPSVALMIYVGIVRLARRQKGLAIRY